MDAPVEDVPAAAYRGDAGAFANARRQQVPGPAPRSFSRDVSRAAAPLWIRAVPVDLRLSLLSRRWGRSILRAVSSFYAALSGKPACRIIYESRGHGEIYGRVVGGDELGGPGAQGPCK